MLRVARAGHNDLPAVQADACVLPFADGAVGGVVAAFCLNHLADPAAGLRELARVVAAGGPVVASTYAEDDDHPVKHAVEHALRELGWTPPDWYESFRAQVAPLLATSDRCRAAAAAAGLDATVHARCVSFPSLRVAEVIEWRLGMSAHAPFVGALPPGERQALVHRLSKLLDEASILERSILVITALA
jgi:SAM-dependent methyltransferase